MHNLSILSACAVCSCCHVQQQQLTQYIPLVRLARDKHTCWLSSPSPLICRWSAAHSGLVIAPLSSQGVGESLVSSSDAIETPAAVHCCAHVCEGVYVFNSPPLLSFDVSLVCQLTKCTHKHG